MKSKKDITSDELYLWFGYVDAYRARGEAYNNIDEVMDMWERGNSYKLAEFLHRLRKVPGMKYRADSLQGELSLKFRHNAKSIVPKWLEDGVTPEEAYYMMPIAAEEIITDAEKEWERRDVV